MNLCDDILADGREKLSLSMGIVSRIDNGSYEIAVVSSDTNFFIGGEIFPLQDTYCRDVYEKKQTIALTEIDGFSGLQRHPLYESLPLEVYLGSPIIVNDNVWGTLNFSSMTIRSAPFGRNEILFNENAAKMIADMLEKL